VEWDRIIVAVLEGRCRSRVGVVGASGAAPSLRCAQCVEQFVLRASAPGVDQERVLVELFGEDVVDGGDVLAGVLPVRTAAGRLENRRAMRGKRVSLQAAKTSSMSCGISPASSLASGSASPAMDDVEA
jgi:hypothetical protein